MKKSPRVSSHFGTPHPRPQQIVHTLVSKNLHEKSVYLNSATFIIINEEFPI